MKLKTFFAGVVIIGALLAVAGGLGYTKYRAIKAGMASGGHFEMPETVIIEAAERVPFQRSITAVGTVEAVRHVMLTNELAGKVIEVGFESGQVVDEGHVLLRMDTSTERADLRSAEAAVNLADVTLRRLKTALAGKAVSEQELDRAHAELEQAQARVEQLKATIDKKEIRAAFHGRVGLRDIHPGQYLSEGKTITSLQGLADEMYVDFSVPQLQAAMLRVGSPVVVSFAGIEVPAKIIAFDSQLDLSTRNVRVRAAVPSMEGRLTPGMSLDVRIPLGEPVEVIAAPPTAIRHAPFGDHLYVIEPDPADATKLRARQRFVRVAGAVGNKVIVSEGLKEGEKVATDGSFKLREGALVNGAPQKADGAQARPAHANEG
jgi:membrane fusion protein, multidrug efflux system